MIAQRRSPQSQPALRLFTSPGTSQPAPPAELSPEMKLRDFFQEWMLPVVLTGQLEVERKTVLVYEDALNWWETVSGDPPLSAIDEVVWSRFATGLREAKYKRGPLAPLRAMSRSTQSKHQRTVRAILGWAEKKRLVLPFEVVIRSVPTEVKPCFSLERARQLVGWLRGHGLQKSANLGWDAPRWLACLCSAFYTGFRSGELLAIRSQYWEEREGAPWICLPGEVTKTGKPNAKIVHACLREALTPIWPLTRETLVFDWPHDYRHLLTCHAKLQVLAGIPEEETLPLHAWRRTFCTQIALTGLQQARDVAQQALCHSDQKTTEASYLAPLVEATAIRMLPRLW